MRESATASPEAADSGLAALCAVAAYHRIAADADGLRRELALEGRAADADDLLRAAKLLGLKARLVETGDRQRVLAAPTPAIVAFKDGSFAVYGGRTPRGGLRAVDPLTRAAHDLTEADFFGRLAPQILLLARRFGGPGVDRASFNLRWFLPSIWRYRHPLAHVLLASLFIQFFGLATPIFFQVVVDKVLAHRSYATLDVLAIGLVLIGVFEAVLLYLRTYVLTHTVNRIDVELGRRLFQHLLRLPISYFETRPAGQTVARIRELESIRGFLTGQALFCALDFAFVFVFVLVLLAYSWRLSLIVIGSLPVYAAIGFLIRPALRARAKEKFNRGAASQQFLVETVVAMPTVKSAAVEPLMQAQWEERLAAYVRTSFDVSLLAALGQNLVQLISRLSGALLLLFGAYAAMNGDLSIGALVAFNMIASQTIAPMLRLSQLWQDVQQVRISLDRLGDILDQPSERIGVAQSGPRPHGGLEVEGVTFRYRPCDPAALTDVSLSIRPGEVIGVVGPSGSGKSSLSKLIQRLYLPEAGRIALDGADLAHVHPAWLRGHIGVVPQENILFNRSIHDNIAFSRPAMSRAAVVTVARLTGADEFISRLPEGYDTMVEERGANLSGGQRQRIGLARALANDPVILILDEATSALDPESERAIHRNMARIVENRTVIIIAHRLSAVRFCDRIVGIENGRLVEEGAHADLLRRPQGLYARLWRAQNDAALA